MPLILNFCRVWLFVCVLTATVQAQPVSVQQPVVQQFGIGTTVTVPDRGSMRLGGIGSAAGGRVITGPMRSGYGLGQQTQGSSASAHVFIHDFEALDAELLNQPVDRPKSGIESRMLTRLEQRPGSVPPERVEFRGLDALPEAERLAEQAAARGKPGVAKLHWQRAARYGSQRAKQKLAELKK